LDDAAEYIVLDPGRRDVVSGLRFRKVLDQLSNTSVATTLPNSSCDPETDDEGIDKDIDSSNTIHGTFDDSSEDDDYEPSVNDDDDDDDDGEAVVIGELDNGEFVPDLDNPVKLSARQWHHISGTKYQQMKIENW